MELDKTKLKLLRLHLDYQFSDFDCGDTDLNEFLLKESVSYYKKRLAVTYLLEFDNKAIAFFSVLNDKISIKEFKGNPTLWDEFRSRIPDMKNVGSYPAVKLGRLAVDNGFRRKEIGKTLVNYIKQLFITNNRTGCGFITVDAYSESLGFYEKLGFKYLTEKDVGKDTRLMYFYLATLE